MKKNKILSLFLALVMMLAVVVPATKVLADDAKPTAKAEPEKTKVVVHKVKLDNLEGMPKEADGKIYDGTKIADLSAWFEGKNPKTMEGVAFKIFNVAEDGRETPYLETGGQKVYLTNGQGEIEVILPKGTYKFYESKDDSTYQGQNGETLSDQEAVPFTITLPMVHENGNYFDENVALHVYPKNTEVGKPDSTKELDETTAEESVKDKSVKIGDKVPYLVTTKIKAGSTYKMVAWNDKMTDGLTFNKDVEITSLPDLQLKDQTDYEVEYSDNGFVLKFTESGLKKLAKKTAPAKEQKFLEETFTGENTEVTFTLKYSSTVNNSAIVENPLENTNTFHYGNVPGFTPEPGDFTPPPVTPKEGKIIVEKSFISGTTTAAKDEEWPEGLTVKLKLQVYDPENNTWTDVNEKTLELNKDKKSGEFTELDNDKQYKVVEVEVKGWTPNYSLGQDGKVVIKNKKNPNPTPITPAPVTVRTGGIKFFKFAKEKDSEKGLENAIFVIKTKDGKYLKAKPEATKVAEEAAYKAAEKAYKEAVENYNKLPAEKQNEEAGQVVETAKDLRDKTFKAMKAEWEFTQEENEAYKLYSGKDGKFEIKGLDFGTYNLEELVPPLGYAKLQGDKEFEVTAKSYSTDEKLVKIENKKVSIPQTGGIGTLIFTVAGIALMAGAAIAMRRGKEEQ